MNEIKIIVDEIMEYLQINDYICIEDYLTSKNRLGKIEGVKKSLNLLFRNAEQISLIEYKERESKYIEILLNHRKLNKQFQTHRFNLAEINNQLDDFNQKYHNVRAYIAKEEMYLEQVNDSFEISDLRIHRLQGQLKEIRRNIQEDLHEYNENFEKEYLKSKELQKDIDDEYTMQQNLNQLKHESIRKIHAYKEEIERIKPKKEQLTLEKYQKKQESSEFFRMHDSSYSLFKKNKMEFLLYLDYKITQKQKMYIYNVWTYKLEFLKDYRELEDKLHELRQETPDNREEVEGNLSDIFGVLINYHPSKIAKLRSDLAHLNGDFKLEHISNQRISPVITNLQNYLRYIDREEALTRNKQMKYKYYYRGQADSNYISIPSIYRNDSYIENEHTMYHEIHIKNPSEFKECKSHLEILATMQHYSLPTRLLDITSSPLIAAFFTIEGDRELARDGELIIYRVLEKEIKYYDSDKVEVLSTLSLMSNDDKLMIFKAAIDSCLKLLELSLPLNKEKSVFNENLKEHMGNIISTFNENVIIKKLIHEIEKEWKNFSPLINPFDLIDSCIVKPKQNNNRIIRQHGAFIVNGIFTRKDCQRSIEKYKISREVENDYLRAIINEMDLNVQDLYKAKLNKSMNVKIKYIIPSNSKTGFRTWLNDLEINEPSVYPELEKVANYLKGQYL